MAHAKVLPAKPQMPVISIFKLFIRVAPCLIPRARRAIPEGVAIISRLRKLAQAPKLGSLPSNLPFPALYASQPAHTS
jgi:hypothetical protein